MVFAFKSLRYSCVLGMLAVAVGGCQVCQEATGSLRPANAVLLTSPTVTIDAFSINGTHPPDEAWDHALGRFKKYLVGELVVKWHEMSVPVGEDGLPTHKVDVDVAKTGLDCIIIVFLPKDPRIRRGLYTRFDNGMQLIQYDAEGIGESAAGLLPAGKMWEIVLLHELGHAIGVPTDASHADKGGHCTNPNCVMYPRPDVCSALSVIVRGWPLDFCDECRKEIERARNAPDVP